MKIRSIVFILFVYILAGCGKAEQSSNQQQEDTQYPYVEPFYYADTVNCSAITADVNGLLYTATYGDSTQEINVYDLDGTCVEQMILGTSTGGASLLEAGEGALYLIAPELDCMYVLYEIDMATWQAKKLYSFYGYEYINNLVRIGDYVYVFGRLENPEQKEYEQYSEDTFFTYNGEVIGRLSVTAEIPEMETIPEIFSGGKRNPVINARCPPAEPPMTKIFFLFRIENSGRSLFSRKLAASRQSSPQAGQGSFTHKR